MLLRILLLILLAPSLWGAEIQQIKGKKALVVLAPGEFNAGDQVYAVDLNGKRKALLQISKVKGNKAIAEILKGSPAVGHSLQMKGGSVPAPSAASEEAPAEASQAYSARPPLGFMKRGKSALGFGISQSSNSLAIQAANTTVSETINLKSSTIGFHAYVDLQQSRSLTWRLGTGYQSFGGTGTTNTASFCSGSKNCELAISYLTAEGWLQFNLIYSASRSRMWVGAGGEFMLAASKKNNISALTVDSWSTFIFGSLGGDLALSQSSALTTSFDYGLQPTAAAGAKAGLTMLRLGFSFLY